MSIDSVFFIHFNPGKTRLLKEKKEKKKKTDEANKPN
jgi:hypothetical protein